MESKIDAPVSTLTTATLRIYLSLAFLIPAMRARFGAKKGRLKTRPPAKAPPTMAPPKNRSIHCEHHCYRSTKSLGMKEGQEKDSKVDGRLALRQLLPVSSTFLSFTIPCLSRPILLIAPTFQIGHRYRLHHNSSIIVASQAILYLY